MTITVVGFVAPEDTVTTANIVSSAIDAEYRPSEEQSVLIAYRKGAAATHETGRAAISTAGVVTLGQTAEGAGFDLATGNLGFRTFSMSYVLS